MQIEAYACNMHGYINRTLHSQIEECLEDFPVLAILGPRQCGKTTLAQEIVTKITGGTYLDLEKPSDLRKLEAPELYFEAHRSRHKESLFCLDEIQRAPELFPVLRSLIDQSNKSGQFLILGSASRDLIRQTSESLAGRIAYLELTPFSVDEVEVSDISSLINFWLRGGFPRSYLSRSDVSSCRWRENFIRTYLEQDIPQLGFNIPAKSLHRLWRMLAHSHGQIFNSSKIGASLGISHTTVRSYLDLLSQTFMVRVLEPLEANLKKRLIKSPKVYIRDSGILHTLLEVETNDDLLGHPVFGSSWEGFVIENIITALPKWQPAFYRTANGAEIDLILSKGQKRIAIECKATRSPSMSRGAQNALNDLEIEEAWIIAPVDGAFPISSKVTVSSLQNFIRQYQ